MSTFPKCSALCGACAIFCSFDKLEIIPQSPLSLCSASTYFHTDIRIHTLSLTPSLRDVRGASLPICAHTKSHTPMLKLADSLSVSHSIPSPSLSFSPPSLTHAVPRRHPPLRHTRYPTAFLVVDPTSLRVRLKPARVTSHEGRQTLSISSLALIRTLLFLHAFLCNVHSKLGALGSRRFVQTFVYTLGNSRRSSTQSFSICVIFSHSDLQQCPCLHE